MAVNLKVYKRRRLLAQKIFLLPQIQVVFSRHLLLDGLLGGVGEHGDHQKPCRFDGVLVNFP